MLERLRALLAPRYVDPVWVADGGMGVVYAARDVTLDRRVAVKVLAPELATADGAARFLREARILARLSHPHIVPIHEVREGDGLYVYIMAFVDGETLAARLQRGPLAPADARSLADQVLGALARAHREGIVHRDVKPGNIFCTAEGAMLADFGIARWADDSAITRPDDRPGTPDYMAPEQFASGEITARADVYSTGRVIYEAATCRRWELAADPGAADWTGVPADLVPALARALEPAPAARWPDARAFRAALSGARGRSLKSAGLAAGLFIAAVLAGLTLGSGEWARPGNDRGGTADLALLPFEEGDSAALGRRLALFASQRLEWYPRWTMLPRLESFGDWDARGGLRARARHQVRGALARRTDGWTLTVSVHDSTGRLREAFEVPRAVDELAWARAAADSIVAHLFPVHLQEYRELEGGSTESEPAALEYVRGTDAFHRDSLSAAARHYESALRIDPGFTQARWQLLLVRRWERDEVGPELRDLYDRYREELPPVFASITAAQLDPDLRRRADTLLALEQRHGALARFIAADELFHRGPLVGIPLASSLALLDERSAGDPFVDATSSTYHSAWGYIRLGDRVPARRALAQLQRGVGEADAEGALRVKFLRLAYDARFRPALGRAKLWLLARSADSATTDALARYVRLGLAFDLPDAQLQLAEALRRNAQAPPHTRQAGIARALALFMLGRADDALALLDQAAAHDRSLELQAAEWRLVPEILGLSIRNEPERSRAIGTLEAVARAKTPESARACWILAMLALRSGDAEALAAWRTLLASDPSPTAIRLERLVQAAAIGDRQPDSALALTRPLFETDSAGLVGGPFGRSALYLARADWLARLGRLEAADSTLGWYENSDFGAGWLEGAPHGAEVDLVMSVPARVRRAGLAIARGDTTAACRYLDRAREIWKKSDVSNRAVLAPMDSIACR